MVQHRWLPLTDEQQLTMAQAKVSCQLKTRHPTQRAVVLQTSQLSTESEIQSITQCMLLITYQNTIAASPVLVHNHSWSWISPIKGLLQTLSSFHNPKHTNSLCIL